MAFGGGDCKAVQVPRQLCGNQTLAAMLFRSEAQDKTQEHDYCRNEYALGRLRRKLCRGSS